ncbi:APC family permease [Ralstonia sp. CHL-2022]|jgi:amino acid transporter|uniref:APC family permease n=1 Tax=Ralstonia mojiangensis TaxID=2953895 RepID=A0AAE3I4H5_9RALS|nr:APC family permease [Ralstonia mojiangensis]MCT7317339.1 APC family permease [Ralstonia mojiangensis]
MPESSTQPNEHTSLKRDTIGWFTIFLMVITTNGPLTSMGGGVPASITLGNGIGLPGSYLIVCAAYLLFAVGFCAMSPYVKNGGAFYAYITKGLGTIPGVGGACIAVLSYVTMLLACYAMLGHFMSVALSSFGISIPWWGCAGAAAIAAHLLCVRGIEFTGRLLLLLMLSEVGSILLADLLELLRAARDHHPLSLLPFAPQSIFTQGFGPSLIFVVASFMGFETAAIYSQEAREAQRSVPRAMYFSIVFIGALYAASIWLMLNHFGMADAVAVASNDPGGMWLSMFSVLAGHTAAQIGSLLVMTSLFAAVLSFTNVVARYWHALATRGLVWHALSRTHLRHQSPHIASAVTMCISVSLILLCAKAGLNPMLQVLPWASVPSAVGVLACQTLAAVAVVAFFRRNRTDVSPWRSLVAPAVSAAVLLFLLWEMIAHVELLSGLSAVLSYGMAMSVLLAGVIASFYAADLRRRSPKRYAELSELVHLP